MYCQLAPITSRAVTNPRMAASKNDEGGAPQASRLTQHQRGHKGRRAKGRDGRPHEEDGGDVDVVLEVELLTLGDGV